MFGGTISRLQAEDLMVFRRIRLEALHADHAAFASTAADWENAPDEEWSRRFSETTIFVAFLNNEPIGMMGLMRQRASKMAHRASVVMVYVRQSMRGLGVSTALFDTLVDYARSTGIRRLELAVSTENPAAQKLYLRKGFVQIGRIPGAFFHDGKEIDEYMMARRIDD